MRKKKIKIYFKKLYIMNDLKKTWLSLGKHAPFYSVMSMDKYLPDNINDNLNDFYESSTSLIKLTDSILLKNNIEFKFNKILDFGCGVGRITNLLSEYGNNIYGIDISEEHLKIARSNVKKNNITFLNYDENYNFPQIINDIDFVVSFIVLQHIRSEEMKLSIKKILNSLSKNGIALLHIPYIIENYDKSILEKNMTDLEIHPLDVKIVLDIIFENNCFLLDRIDFKGISHNSFEYLYLIKKK
jgi:2-polyprenyl-3-methyl-5-hydroxy-6-metoxy-1,4-benzoquinol methylase